MFWTAYASGGTAKIKRSFMDGSERQTIVSSFLSQPNGITVDYISERIYWSDSALDKIEYCNYDGTGRMEVDTEASGLFHPVALTVVDKILFWTDWETDSLYVTHKVYGAKSDEGFFRSVAVFTSDPFGIETVYPNRQQPGLDNCL